MFRTILSYGLIGLALVLPASALAAPLQVAYNQWVGLAPLFIAQNQGFFEAAGVTVEPVEFSGPGASLAPLVAGHIDVSMTTADNVVMLASESEAQPVVVSVLDASQGGDALVARSDIDRVADLEDKTVAVTRGEVNELLLLKALESSELTAADLRTVDMSPDNAGAAFVSGNVDAAVTWEPWVSRATEADGHVLYSSADAANLLVDVAVVTRATLDDNAADIEAFLAGLARGVQFMREQPDEAHAIASEWLSVPSDEVASMLEGVRIYAADEVPPLLAGGGGLRQSLATIAGFLKARDRIAETPDVDSLIDPRLARAVAQ